MKDYNISENSITWTNERRKWETDYVYKNQIIVHEDCISISRYMYVKDELKDINLTHIPLSVLPDLKKML